MSEVAHTNVIPFADFTERVESGLLVPMHSGEGLTVIDCGDHRELTDESLEVRREAIGDIDATGRYFGSEIGLAATSLIAVAAQVGSEKIHQFVEEYSARGFMEFAADLSERAHRRQDGLFLVNHSADSNEGNPSTLSDTSHEQETDLGCKLATHLGYVIRSATEASTLEHAQFIQSSIGREGLPLREVQEGAEILAQYFTDEFGITRGALLHAKSGKAHHAPTAILKDSSRPIGEISIVHDMAGFRSSARLHHSSGVPRFHHTPQIASETIPGLLEEFAPDPLLLEASGSLMGSATHRTLEDKTGQHPIRGEIIPPEYLAAVAA
ncbi:MAG: hypothetical protein ACHQT9_02500 [Candidatus Saccharimonadales bacterium]